MRTFKDTSSRRPGARTWPGGHAAAGLRRPSGRRRGQDGAGRTRGADPGLAGPGCRLRHAQLVPRQNPLYASRQWTNLNEIPARSPSPPSRRLPSRRWWSGRWRTSALPPENLEGIEEGDRPHPGARPWQRPLCAMGGARTGQCRDGRVWPHRPRPAAAASAAVVAANLRPAPVLEYTEEAHAPVSYLELFDLVFVFAITQLSHSLHHHLTWARPWRRTQLFLAVWWGWIFTSWVSNGRPDRLPIRLLLLGVMLASLAMAVAIPDAFVGNGLLFAGELRDPATGPVLRGDADLSARGRGADAQHGADHRVVCGFGAAVDRRRAGQRSQPAPAAVALLALAIEYAGPMTMFRTPVLGRSSGTPGDLLGSQHG